MKLFGLEKISQKWRDASIKRSITKASSFNKLLRILEANREHRVTDPYTEHAWAYACINVLMRKIASVPFIIASRKADEQGNQRELPEHKAAKLLKHVNENMGPSELSQFTTNFLFNKGHAFWLLDIEGTTIRNIWPTNPDTAEPIFERDTQKLVGWRFSIGRRQRVPFSIDELVQFRLPNPNDPIRGLSPTVPAELPISQDFKAAKHNEALLQNQALPRGLLEVPEDTTDDTMRRVIKRWESRHGDVGQRGRIGVLLGGIKFSSVAMDMQELDFIQGRRFNREEILAVFGVPPAEVGVHEFSNFANAESQASKFWNNTLIPVMVMIEQTLDSKFFMKHFPDVVGFFDLANVEDLRDNLDLKSQVAERFFRMGVSFSDVNALLQLGFDTEGVTHLEQGWLPLALVPAGSAPMELPTGTREEAMVPAAFVVRQKQQREFRQRFRLNYTRTITPSIQRMGSRMQGYFRGELGSILTRLQRNYETLLSRHGKALGKWREKEREADAWKGFCAMHLKTLGSDVEDLIFSFDESTAALTPIAESELQEMIVDGGSSVAEILGMTFDTDAPGVLGALSKRVNQIVDVKTSGLNIPQESFERIRDEIGLAIREGESVALASQRIERVYAEFEGFRSVRIAQTEMGFAFNTGDHEFKKQAGINEHEWLSAGDLDVRSSHVIDGQRVRVGDRFSNGLLHPNDPGGSPEEVINCRCVTIPVVEIQQSIKPPQRKRKVKRLMSGLQSLILR